MTQNLNDEDLKRLEEAFKQIVARNPGSRKSSRWGTVMMLSLLILLIMVGVGYYLYKNKYKKNKQTNAKKEESPKVIQPVPEGVRSEPKIVINEQ
jgi:flagellar basal body-associated protein FliL